MVLTEIKEVSSRDLKKIVTLEQQIFKKNAFSKKLIQKLIDNNIFFLKLEIGEIKKELIGFIIVTRDRNNLANIINFIIKPEYQNKGYGSYLLKETLKRLTQLKDLNKIVLNVQSRNLIAIKLYEKFNFKKNPTIIENYYQSGESAFLMELNLDSL
jgi:ribosomal protein S18 acetylase RimI-like enzyme